MLSANLIYRKHNASIWHGAFFLQIKHSNPQKPLDFVPNEFKMKFTAIIAFALAGIAFAAPGEELHKRKCNGKTNSALLCLLGRERANKLMSLAFGFCRRLPE
jgi:hypothetical protein